MSSHSANEPPGFPSTLGVLETLPQNIRLRIFTFALEGSANINVEEDLRYITSHNALLLLQVSRALRDEMIQNVMTLVFRRPAVLGLFLTTEAGLAVPSLFSPRQMTSVRLVILDALEANTDLTAEEESRGEGPNINPLFQKWVDTTRLLPSTVGVIEFDLRHSFPLRFHVVGRLVQRISTTIHVRSGRYTRFWASGCSTAGTQRYIEDGICAPVGGARERGRGEIPGWSTLGDYQELLNKRRCSRSHV